MLSQADMEYLNRLYESGLSICVLSNTLIKEINGVKPYFSRLGERIIDAILNKQDSSFKFEAYHKYEIESPDGIRREVVFRNCYHVDGRDICIENVDLDLGGKQRANLALKGRLNGMTLVCIASDAHRNDTLRFLKQYGCNRKSGVYHVFYDPETFIPTGPPEEI
jgi:hypothetical protein